MGHFKLVLDEGLRLDCLVVDDPSGTCLLGRFLSETTLAVGRCWNRRLSGARRRNRPCAAKAAALGHIVRPLRNYLVLDGRFLSDRNRSLRR